MMSKLPLAWLALTSTGLSLAVTAWAAVVAGSVGTRVAVTTGAARAERDRTDAAARETASARAADL